MRVSRLCAGVCLLATVLLAQPAQRVSAQAPAAVELGTINFPTSAKPAAQAAFLVGTKALYNFEFDLAADAFREAQKADPAFALAYWGEAMSFNHPLWAEQDLASARKVLERLAPTAAARAAKAPSGKERELIDNLLGQRINFFLVFFALMVNGALDARAHNDTQLTNGILGVGVTASLLLALSIGRLQRGSTRYSRKFTPLRPTLPL